ncbi:phage tail fiber protein [Megasphaera hexanoica]|uniref:Phage tail fiber protein n=1 Tax=Megasphaera hexanoica TaxID=1675036 RepID=A0ABW7DLM7_9FIRM|nr:phage tail fiber protein [Megasphaera hexanoica]AXB82003.1 hypothetical protein ACT01_06995 [Megasphaera hexanoica]
MSIFKARVEYEVTDASVKTYSFPFPYLRKEFIKVSILHTDSSITALTYGVDYSVDDLTITLVTSPSVSEHLIIYRETTTDKIITWNDGSILLAKDMNTEDAQMLHLQEEQKDYLIANALATSVTDAKETIWSAQNHRITDVSDPKEPQDTVTKHYMESVQDGFVSRNTSLLEQATTQATNAKNSASSSATSASQSASSASASFTSNQSAKKWAESTASPDNQADTDSTTGKTQSSRSWALYSKSKAQEAATSATNAKTSETKSLASEQNAKDSETNAKTSEIKAATSEVNAKTSETNAKSSETKSKDSENAARVSEQNAAESARVATENAMDFNMLKRNKAYSIGDIAYSFYIPSWARLECVKAGTTGTTVPPALGATYIAGQYITDGTAIFILDDVRDGNRVGDIVLKPTLNDGYIKANGATVKASEYPRLLKFAQDNSLCVSDSEWMDNSATKYVYDASADTLKVPNAMGRVLQGEDTLITKNAGLPNLRGSFNAKQTNPESEGGWVDGRLFSKGWHMGYPAGSGTQTHAGGEIIFNASGYSAIYGSSDTVQPPACCLIAQIKY